MFVRTKSQRNKYYASHTSFMERTRGDRAIGIDEVSGLDQPHAAEQPLAQH